MIDGVSNISAGAPIAPRAQIAQSVGALEFDSPIRETSPTESRPPFVSPAIRIDYELQEVVLEFRDSESGEVTKRIPSENEIRAYQRSETSGLGDIVAQENNFEQGVQVSSGGAENITATPNSLGPSVPLGSGDTSSFSSLA